MALTYTATYTASANTDIANAVVSVDGAWTDAAGNPARPHPARRSWSTR